jgi:hypothetical protein
MSKIVVVELLESERERLGEKKFNEGNLLLFQLALGEWLEEQNVSWADDDPRWGALIERYIAEHPEAQRAIAPFKAKQEESHEGR